MSTTHNAKRGTPLAIRPNVFHWFCASCGREIALSLAGKDIACRFCGTVNQLNGNH